MVSKDLYTNDFTLQANDVIEHYQNQYDVEKAFRISKTDLKIRPIYHRLETRIKAHILISFISYAVYKEFERKIKLSNLDIKFKLTFDYIKTMYGYKTLFGVESLEMDEIQNRFTMLFIQSENLGVLRNSEFSILLWFFLYFLAIHFFYPARFVISLLT